MTSIIINMTCWTNDNIYYITISTHFLEWKCNKVSNEQHLNQLKNKFKMLKQESIEECTKRNIL